MPGLRYRAALLSLVIALLLFAGAFRAPYGDEIDNLVGGKIIASGGALYVDYWSHHMPLPYHIAAGLYAAGARTYLQFRLMWAACIWMLSVTLAAYLRRITPLWMLLAVALVAPSMSANMLTAETCGGYLALAAWLLLMDRRASNPTLIILLLWLMPLATLKLIYLAAVLFAFTVWRYRTRCIASLILPVVLSIIWLAIYRNGAELFEYAYRFNAVYYAAYSDFAGASVIALPFLGMAHFAGALLNMTQSPFPVLLLPFVFAQVGVWCYRRRWRDSLLLTVLVVLSYPQTERQYAPGIHFTAHYLVIIGVAAYAITEIWHAAAVDAGTPAGDGVGHEPG